MAGATFGTREKVSASGKKKWYTTLSFDGRNTERFAGYKESDAYNLGLKLCATYNENRAGIFKDSAVTLRQAVDEFLTREVADNTTVGNRNALEQFIELNPKVTQVKHITKWVLLGWKRELKEVVRTPQGKPLADATVQIRLKCLKAFVRWCVNEKKYLRENPVPAKYLPNYSSTGHYYTPEELAKLMSIRKSTFTERNKADELLACAINIAIHQGIRLSQIWGIELEHIRLEDNRIWTKGLKTAPDKEVLMHPETLKAVRKAAELNEVIRGRVFTNWSTPQTMSQYFRRKCDDVGILVGDFHDLKHTCVSKLEDEGYKLKEISDITNTTPEALRFYSHSSEETLRAKFKNFGYKDTDAA